jgi:hypothetical protein
LDPTKRLSLGDVVGQFKLGTTVEFYLGSIIKIMAEKFV